jgi:rubrerythrin
MKTNYLKRAVSLLFVFGFFAGCTYTKTDKETIENLKTSLISEYTTNAKYNAYSEKAEQEGYPQIGKLFKALATAENVHALKFKNLLGSKATKILKSEPVYLLESTEKNLQNAIVEEIIGMDVIDPGYIKQSENSDVKQANSTFAAVCEAEKSHKNLLVLIYDVLMTRVVKENAVAVASAPSKGNLSKIENLFSKTDYYVCPADGRVFDNTNLLENCPLCNTPKADFIVVSDNSPYVKSIN